MLNYRPRLQSLWPAALIFSLAVGVRLLPGERIVDDAYITFRYARNLVEGAGFVYNPGERVLGTTTPVYTLLLASLAGITGSRDFPALSIWVNALADGLACCALIYFGRLATGRLRVGIAAAALYAIAPFSVTFAIGGLETSLFVLLVVGTGALYLRGSLGWAATAALAVLTRPDALILVGPLAVDHGLRQLAPLRTAASAGLKGLMGPYTIMAVIWAPWLAFASWYFGSPIPHSIAAKSAAYHLGPADALLRFMQHYSTPFFEQHTFTSSEALLTLLVAYLSLAIIGGLAAFRQNTRGLVTALYPFVYLATFAIANPLVFRWYLTPPVPFYFTLLLGGGAHLLDSIARAAGPSASTRARRLSIGMFAIVAVGFGGLSLREWRPVLDHGPARPAPDMAWFKLEQLYTQVGLDLAPHVTPTTVIAAGDIGALGYFSGARILDTLGLVSPESITYYPLPEEQLVITYAIASDLILDARPDYVVFLEVYGRNTLLADRRFLSAYILARHIPTDIYASNGLLVYERLGN